MNKDNDKGEQPGDDPTWEIILDHRGGSRTVSIQAPTEAGAIASAAMGFIEDLETAKQERAESLEAKRAQIEANLSRAIAELDASFGAGSHIKPTPATLAESWQFVADAAQVLFPQFPPPTPPAEWKMVDRLDWGRAMACRAVLGYLTAARMLFCSRTDDRVVLEWIEESLILLAEIAQVKPEIEK